MKISKNKFLILALIYFLALSIKTAEIGGYFESWVPDSDNASTHSLGNMPGYIKYIMLAFANPNTNYVKGSNNFTGTGMDFSNFSLIKSAIETGRIKNPNQIFLLSVGGATFPFSNPNYQNIVDLMTDLGLDGIDIDYENTPKCSNINTDNLSCVDDAIITDIINKFKNILPAGKLLTAAVFNCGAYGSKEYPNNKYLPASMYAGMFINPLKNAGAKLDAIFIMSYDAGDTYKPTEAFEAYKAIFNNKKFIGLEVPPEAWGGVELTVDNASIYAKYAMDNQGSGVFIWALNKATNKNNANMYLQPICNLYSLLSCTEAIPLK